MAVDRDDDDDDDDRDIVFFIKKQNGHKTFLSSISISAVPANAAKQNKTAQCLFHACEKGSCLRKTHFIFLG